MVACGFREAIPDFISFFNDRLFSLTDLGASHRKVRKVRKERKAQSQFRTRMTRIARIFTDTSYPRVSASYAQSVFHRIPSAFICVHLRLIFVSLHDITRKIQFELCPIINDGFMPVLSGILSVGR